MGELVGAAALMSRYVVGFVVLMAAVPKLVDRRSFERALRNYRQLPSSVVPYVAAWLPRLEVACAAGLLLGVAVGLFAGIAAALLALFAAAVAANLASGERFECGCGVGVARDIGWPLVGTDAFLAVLAVVAALFDPGTLSLTGKPDSSVTTADGIALLIVSAVVVAGTLSVQSGLSLRATARSMQRVTAR